MRNSLHKNHNIATSYIYKKRQNGEEEYQISNNIFTFKIKVCQTSNLSLVGYNINKLQEWKNIMTKNLFGSPQAKMDFSVDKIDVTQIKWECITNEMWHLWQ